jgi:hypothetical protein
LYFALGFRAFARGVHANGMGAALTLVLPLAACVLYRTGFAGLAGLVPPGAVYLPTAAPVTAAWLPGPLLAGAVALALGQHTLRHCDADLRRWYDQHHGKKSME